MRTLRLFSSVGRLGLCALLIASPLATRAAPPAAKRVAPPVVAPMTVREIRYEAVQATRARGLPQEGGYVAAIDTRTGAELWLQRIYETRYDPAMEEDVQDVHIRSLRRGAGGKALEIVDELGRCHRLTLVSRELGSCRAASTGHQPRVQKTP